MTTLFEYDPDIGYRFVPHLKTRVASPDGGYLVRTNGQGFRNDREFERDDSTPRILVFGDSFTAGDGVSNGSRYSDVLETLLHELVHLHVGRAAEPRAWHGRSFKLALARAMREAYDVTIPIPRATLHGPYAEAIEARRSA